MALLVTWLDFGQLNSLLRRTDWDWVTLAIAVYLLAIACNAAGVRRLLLGFGHSLTVAAVASIHFRGLFFNYFLPTNFGGDLYRVYTLGRTVLSTGHAAMAIVLQRTISMFAALLLIAIAVPLFSPARIEVAGIAVILSIAVGVLLAGAAFVRFPNSAQGWMQSHPQMGSLLATWQRITTAFHGLRRRRVLPPAVMWLFVSQLMTVAAAAAMSRSLQLDVAAVHFAYIVPLSYFAAAIPLTINGIGIREGAIVLILGQLGVARGDATAFALALLAMNISFALLGGVLFAMSSQRSLRPADDASTDVG